MVATALYFVATMRGVRKVEVVWVADVSANGPLPSARGSVFAATPLFPNGLGSRKPHSTSRIQILRRFNGQLPDVEPPPGTAVGLAAHAVVRPFYSLTKPRLPLQLPSLLIGRLGRGRWSGDGAAVVCHTEFLSSVPNILLCHLATVGCVCKRILRASARSTVVDMSSTRTPPALSHTLSAAPSSRTAAAMSMINATPP